MKSSPYNLFLKTLVGPDYLGYNTLTNALIEFSPQDYEKVLGMLSSVNPPASGNGSEHLWKMLVDGGFMVDGDFDFKAELRARYFRSHNSKSLSLTIAPTLQCNFRCSYCFEENRNESMPAVVQSKLLELVREKLPEDGGLHVTWFGGEPLLALETIEDLYRNLQAICAERNAKYNGNSIITNGYLLSPGVAERLKAMNINSVQITLDGPPEIHDRRRPLANGGGTFAAIMDNIKKAKDQLNIVVRLNVDKSNPRAIYGLRELFDGEGLENVHIYPGHVQAYTEMCKDLESSCISSEEFLEFKWDYELHELAQGRYLQGYPSLLYGYCIAGNPNGYVIAPSGLIFKCWNEISNDQTSACGDLAGERSEIMDRNREKWLQWDPFSDGECVRCLCAPLCMGGCPYIRMRFHVTSCSQYKKHIGDIIALYQALGRLHDVSKVFEEKEISKGFTPSPPSP